MKDVYLSLGGNIGDVCHTLQEARKLIDKEVGKITEESSLYKTAAWGNENQPDFLNQVICLKTDLKPLTVLETCLSIEQKLGRVRHERWGERKVDIDILFFQNDIITKDNLKLPHPEIQNRLFVLVPFAEIAPAFVHPTIKKTISTLIKECKDELAIERIN